MSILTLATIPGFSDLQNTALAANNISLGAHFSRISSNASFGVVRLEFFVNVFKHNDVVPLPTSTVDGYTYTRDELMYFWVPQNTANQATGWASFREPWTMWYGIWNVDQTTGTVFSEIGYRGNNDHKDNQASTNDGTVQIFTIAQRQRTKLILSAQPSFVRHVDTDFFTDAPLTTGLMTDLNADAKFATVNQEVIYMGEFTNGQTVPQPVSPADGRTYAYSECVFLTSIRWTADDDGAGHPLKPAINKGQLQDWATNVGPSGIVRIANSTVTYELSGQHAFNTGLVAVFAFCTRPLGTTFTATQNLFAELDDTDFFAPGNTLRASTVKQINRNIGQAVCTPEFFGPFDITNGGSISLPTSPLDGYTYARSELMYVWQWLNTGPSANTTGRLSLVHGEISSTGVATVNDFRFNSGASAVALAHEGTMRVLVVAKRSTTNGTPPTVPINSPNFGTDAIPETFGNLDTIPDGVFKKGTGADLTYRPLSNPLLGHATGNIDISAFTMRLSSRGDLSLNSATLTGLTLDTLYYIYYDDPNLVGAALGSVTYIATTTKETALNGNGRFFVGSVRLPKTGGGDNIGNNDGGSGASLGNIDVLLFTSTATVGAVSNPDNIVDGDSSSKANFSLTGNGGINTQQVICSGMPGFTTNAYSSMRMRILWQVVTNTLNGTGTRVQIIFNDPLGTTITVNAGVTRALTTDSVAFPVSMNPKNIQVTIQVFTTTGSTSGTISVDVYAAWVEGNK